MIFTAQEYAEKIETLYDLMEDLVEKNFLERVAELSRHFPKRIVEVSAGMGRCNVYISAKTTGHSPLAWMYRFAGETRYDLNHGGDIDAPEFLQEWRDWLFDESEAIEDNDHRYNNYPMIGCGSVKFLNGEKQ
tara:strand:+ start:179 stop:577 length:399 start_codon:yes stop_codon:yes gene_type:complete